MEKKKASWKVENQANLSKLRKINKLVWLYIPFRAVWLKNWLSQKWMLRGKVTEISSKTRGRPIYADCLSMSILKNKYKDNCNIRQLQFRVNTI